MAKPAKSEAAHGLKRLRERAGLSVRDVASAINRPASSYATYENAYKKPFLPIDLVRTLVPVFEARGVPRAELLQLAGINADAATKVALMPPKSTSASQGRPPIPGGADPFTIGNEEYFPVPVYDISASAGPGSINVDGSPLHHGVFRTQWLRRFARNGFDHLAVISVRGDSMWETLHDGDHVLIDRAVDRVGRDGIYVIRQGDELAVKRISVHPVSKLLTVKSDNPAYPTYSDIDPDQLTVIGRGVWLGRSIG
jgi:phage repressor protein C with HTH and peptisase S24 domain